MELLDLPTVLYLYALLRVDPVVHALLGDTTSTIAQTWLPGLRKPWALAGCHVRRKMQAPFHRTERP